MAGRGNGRILLQNFRAMTHNPFLYSHYEEHVRVHCDGIGIHSDGLRSGSDALPFPEFYARGLFAIYQLLEAMLPGLACISVMGMWEDDADAPFTAFDLWLQTGEEDGFYLPMATAASLFGQNGIPYFHKPQK